MTSEFIIKDKTEFMHVDEYITRAKYEANDENECYNELKRIIKLELGNNGLDYDRNLAFHFPHLSEKLVLKVGIQIMEELIKKGYLVSLDGSTNLRVSVLEN